MKPHEIAKHGTARTYAQLHGDDEAVQLREQSPGEEKRTGDQLPRSAQRRTVQAMNA